jgi:HEAT repeat protein
MRRFLRGKALVVALVVGLPSLALGFVSTPGARERLTSLLRSIEGLPDPARLDEAAGADAGALLRGLVDDDSVPAHARLEAISELSHYPGSDTEAKLRQLIEHGRSLRTGAGTLYARAAAMSLGTVARSKAVTAIVPLLEHPVPDVRADAARALELTGSADALPALRARRAIETSVMVKAEIAEAIGVLTP